MNSAIFHQGSIEELDLVCSLWEKLNRVHFASTINFKERYEMMNWQDRKQSLIDKSKVLHLEYASDSVSEQIIGYCISTVAKDSKFGEVDSLFISEPYRKTGLGEELFSRSIKWLDYQKVEVQKLSVSVGNEAVLDFYKRFNFYPLHIILQRKK
jgi:diamine N-acetyltransferase